MLLMDKQLNKQALDSLEADFLTGVKVSIPEMVNEYFNPDTPFAYKMAERSVKSWMSTMKTRMMKKHHLCFGRVDNLGKKNSGRYGIAQTEADYRYVNINLLKHVRGTIRNAQHWNEEAFKNGFLSGKVKKTQFRIDEVLLDPEDEEEEEKKKQTAQV